MIWDDLVARSQYLRGVMDGAQFVETPFPIVPLKSTGREEELERLIPLLKGDHNTWICTDWARPPYSRIALCHPESVGGYYFEIDPLAVTKESFREGTATWSGLTYCWIITDGGVACLSVVRVISIVDDSHERMVFTIQNPEKATHLTLRAQGLPTAGPWATEWIPKIGPSPQGNAAIGEIAAMSVVTAFALMNCKNITSEVVAGGSRQVRRARERGGQPPLFHYHRLLLTGVSSARRAGSHGPTGEPIAHHWVRGHFKDYRQKGIFGKAKGVYWWSPHVAGTADRVVAKDYVLR